MTATLGTAIDLRVQLLRGREPRGRATVVLKGSGAIPGGAGRDALAFTDAQGFATFHVLTGTTPGTHRLTVALSNGEPVAGSEIELVTTPGTRRELRAAVTPGELVVGEGAPARGVVLVTVTDEYGTRVARVPVQLGPLTATLTGVMPLSATNERGQATLVLPPRSVLRGGEVGVFSNGARIGSFFVRLRPGVLAAQRTRFVGADSLRGQVGTAIGQPLVFEVRDTSGAPAAAEAVSFTAKGASVDPLEAVTDSTGVARVRVTLGERPGLATVTARVRTITRSITLAAEPGPARELIVLYDSARVRGSLTLKARKPIVLQVVARDAYGNETALKDFVAVATGQTVHLEAARVTGAAEGVVRLAPRRQGTGELALRAGGLETRVPIQVAFAPVPGEWVFGARGSWTGFSYDYAQLPYVRGRPGVRVQAFLGRAFTPQLRAELVGSVGSLNADSGTVERSVSLKQAYLRGEYAFLTDAPVVPVVSLGTGVFRILSDDPGRLVYHTSLFWFVGAGADVTLGPRAIGEFRLETQQLNEMSSQYFNGHVGALTVVEAGVRLSL